MQVQKYFCIIFFKGKNIFEMKGELAKQGFLQKYPFELVNKKYKHIFELDLNFLLRVLSENA